MNLRSPKCISHAAAFKRIISRVGMAWAGSLPQAPPSSSYPSLQRERVSFIHTYGIVIFKPVRQRGIQVFGTAAKNLKMICWTENLKEAGAAVRNRTRESSFMLKNTRFNTAQKTHTTSSSGPPPPLKCVYVQTRSSIKSIQRWCDCDSKEWIWMRVCTATQGEITLASPGVGRNGATLTH